MNVIPIPAITKYDDPQTLDLDQLLLYSLSRPCHCEAPYQMSSKSSYWILKYSSDPLPISHHCKIFKSRTRSKLFHYLCSRSQYLTLSNILKPKLKKLDNLVTRDQMYPPECPKPQPHISHCNLSVPLTFQGH